MPLQTYLELHVKNAVTEALGIHRDVMRDQFQIVLDAVNGAKIENARDHATTTSTLEHIKGQVGELQKLEPRLVNVESEIESRDAVAVAIDKVRDWNLRLVLAAGAILGVVLALH